MNHFDLISIWFNQPYAFSTTWLIDVLDFGRAFNLGDLFEVFLTRGEVGQTDKARLAEMCYMDMMLRVSAPHIKRVCSTCRSNKPEIDQEFLLDIKVGRTDTAIGYIKDFDHRHFVISFRLVIQRATLWDVPS